METEDDGVVAPNAMNQVTDTFGEACAIATEGEDRESGVGELGTSSEWNDTAVQAMEAVAHELVRRIAVTPNVVTEHNTMWWDAEFGHRHLGCCPNTVVATAVAPRTRIVRVEGSHS
jgi:hypothetical protein